MSSQNFTFFFTPTDIASCHDSSKGLNILPCAKQNRISMRCLDFMETRSALEQHVDARAIDCCFRTVHDIKSANGKLSTVEY